MRVKLNETDKITNCKLCVYCGFRPFYKLDPDGETCSDYCKLDGSPLYSINEHTHCERFASMAQSKGVRVDL